VHSNLIIFLQLSNHAFTNAQQRVKKHTHPISQMQYISDNSNDKNRHPPSFLAQSSTFLKDTLLFKVINTTNSFCTPGNCSKWTPQDLIIKILRPRTTIHNVKTWTELISVQHNITILTLNNSSLLRKFTDASQISL